MRPFSGFAVRSGGLRSNRLRKAPRRHTLQCETLETRQMLSADGLDLAGLDLAGLDTPTAFPPGAITSAIVDGGDLVDGGDGVEAIEGEKGPITPLPNSPLLDLSEEDTFNLASNPDSQFTIFLDFDGHVTQNPFWDAALATTRPRFGQSFDTPAFDVDGDEFNFSELELDIIQESFVRIAEDFAPFDVNVTTIAPPIQDLENDGSEGDRFGVRVAIGGSTFDWLSLPGQGVGGVALLGSFSSSLDTPAFAFVEGGIANPQGQALVVAHEVGHTLGLQHWGDFLLPPFDPELPPLSPDFQNSFPGHGFNNPNGLSWGPILGAPFNAEVTQWSQGEYTLAANPPVVRPRPQIDGDGNIVFDDAGDPVIPVDDNGVPLNFFNDFDPSNDEDEMTAADLGSVLLQDDLAVITSGANGFTFRADDHVDTLDDPDVSPTPLVSGDPSESGVVESIGFGLIETNTDVDFFAFDTDGGEITIDATPNAFGANLDIRFDVFGPDGQFIDFGAQDFDLTATLTFVAPVPGTYFISVTGDAFATNPQEQAVLTTGYSDYGSLGRYTLTVNDVVPSLPDRFEVNDSIPEATVLGTGDFAIDDVSIHVTGDEDFFQVQSGGDGVLNVTADFLRSEGDIALFLLDETGQVLTESTATVDGESLSFPVEDGEVFFVQVVGVGGATQASYNLLIDGPGLMPDRFEVNDSIPEATFVGSGSFSADDLSIHISADEDFFQWQAGGNGVLDVTAEFLQSEGDLELFVLNESGEVIGQSIGTIDGESLSIPVEDGEIFFVQVVGVNGAIQGSYDLTIDGPGLSPDEFEENDTAETAFVIPGEEFFAQPNFHIAGDEDFFLWQAVTDSEPIFSVTAGTSDIAFEVIDENQVVTPGQLSDTGSLTAAVTASAGQQFLVRIFSPSGQEITPYQFVVGLSDDIGDRLEPNDQANPTIIDTELAVFNNISIHTPTDTDFFSFTAPSNGTLNVDANFQDIFGDLDVQIFDASNAELELIALGSSITDNESLTVQVEAGVTYLIETFGFQGALVPIYGITTEFIAAPPVPGDATGDGVVDLDDFDEWLNQLGQSGGGLSADFNGDNTVDIADYTVWRDIFSIANAASSSAAAVTSASGTPNLGGGHGPGCNCAACSAQASSVLHDHNGDGIADHAGHDHTGVLLYPGEALPILSEPLLPPDRSVARSVPEQPPEPTQPVLVEIESVEIPASLVTVLPAVGAEATAPNAASAGEATPASPTSDLALLLLDSAAGDEAAEDLFETFAEDESSDDDARDDAFAAVGDLI